MRIKVNPLVIACLIAAVGCGRGVVPQQSEPVTKYIRTTDTVEIAPSNDFYLGDDCTAVTDQLAKCKADVNGLLAENAELRKHKCPKCDRRPKRVTINIESGNKNKKGTQISGSSVDSSTIQSANDKTASGGDAAIKDVGNTKKSGNTKEGKDRFWLGVLVATAAFQGLRLAKKYAVLLPPPFGLILSKVLNILA